MSTIKENNSSKEKKKRKKKCNLASKSAFEPFNLLFYYAFSASILQIQLLSNFFKKEFGGGGAATTKSTASTISGSYRS
jgi:hypothetical protein